jgi:hypothetical protein
MEVPVYAAENNGRPASIRKSKCNFVEALHGVMERHVRTRPSNHHSP